MNYFGKRTLEPQSHSIEDRHLHGDEIILTHVAPVEIGANLCLLNANGDGDLALYDRRVFDMTDTLDIQLISHILDADGVLHNVASRSVCKKVGHEIRLMVLSTQEGKTMLAEVVINYSTGEVISSGNDRVKGFILGGSRGFNSNNPRTNLLDRPAPKRKRGRLPKSRS